VQYSGAVERLQFRPTGHGGAIMTTRASSGNSGEKTMTLGIIVGNRGFFPDHLAKTGREEMLRVLEQAGIDVVALTPEESKYGAVETRE
jgi:hypothetical protein